MNIVDYVIIGIIGISVLFGLYRGFIASVLNMGCGLMSFLASFWVSPKLAAAVQSQPVFSQHAAALHGCVQPHRRP